MKVALLGGTFDPFHKGHSAILEAAMEEIGIDIAYVAPVQIPPHKNAKNVSAFHHRFAMTALSVADDPRIIPIKLGDSSYAVDEIAALKSMHPDDPIYYIMGLDSFLDLHNWHNAAKLPELCKFVVSRRPGFNDNTLKKASFYSADRVHMINQVYLSISSTEIRASINSGQWLAKQLVRSSVFEYIHKTGIYKAKAEAGKHECQSK